MKNSQPKIEIETCTLNDNRNNMHNDDSPRILLSILISAAVRVLCLLNIQPLVGCTINEVSTNQFDASPIFYQT